MTSKHRHTRDERERIAALRLAIEQLKRAATGLGMAAPFLLVAGLAEDAADADLAAASAYRANSLLERLLAAWERDGPDFSRENSG